ncbi:MAG: hypothetical protein GXO99_00985, partial [Nitrospirae bacterium]|nr:hypothetical protein [Nitrospirota bacterium]
MREILKRARRPLLIVVMIIVLSLVGCTNKETVKKDASSVPQKSILVSEGPTITSLKIESNVVSISADKGFQYTVYKPEDPFKMVVEIPGVTPGAFEGIHKGKGGMVTEVFAQHVK